MPILYMTVGLPASGKSSTAYKMVEESNGSIVEVTKDALRKLPDAPEAFGKRERWVVSQRDKKVVNALSSGKSIIVHDTNFNPLHKERLQRLAFENGADFEVLDFTDVAVTECIRRDALRADPVGETVIWEMWQKYLYVSPTSQVSENLPSAVIVDIDGTLARMTSRRPFDWHKVHEDLPVSHIVDLVKDLHSAGTTILYVSGRDSSCMELTQKWLQDHVSVPGPLFMRPTNDSRKDSVVKEELYIKHIKDRYNIRFVLDDRDQVVHMWRTIVRVPVLQVDYGKF